MKNSKLIIAIIGLCLTGLTANAAPVANAPAVVPMVEPNGFYGAFHYDAILDTAGKLAIQNTDTKKIVYTKKLKSATLNQLQGYAYGLGQETVEIETTHYTIMCMMVAFEGSVLSVSLIPQDASDFKGALRPVLGINSCWNGTTIAPKDASMTNEAETLKALMISLVNESGLLDRNVIR